MVKALFKQSLIFQQTPNGIAFAAILYPHTTPTPNVISIFVGTTEVERLQGVVPA
jgi:hypothetical protein